MAAMAACHLWRFIEEGDANVIVALIRNASEPIGDPFPQTPEVVHTRCASALPTQVGVVVDVILLGHALQNALGLDQAFTHQ